MLLHVGNAVAVVEEDVVADREPLDELEVERGAGERIDEGGGADRETIGRVDPRKVGEDRVPLVLQAADERARGVVAGGLPIDERACVSGSVDLETLDR